MTDSATRVDPDIDKVGCKPGRLETTFEGFLFGSRWLAAPIYLFLVFGLLLLIAAFLHRMQHGFALLLKSDLTKDEAILWVLDSIDIALVANLLLIVILAGYEHFVSKIDTANDEDRPGWMGTVDFSGIKLKLFASIIGLTGIEILKFFMAVRGPEGTGPAAAHQFDSNALLWMLIIHATFLFTALLSALADWLTGKTEAQSARTEQFKEENALAVGSTGRGMATARPALAAGGEG